MRHERTETLAEATPSMFAGHSLDSASLTTTAVPLPEEINLTSIRATYVAEFGDQGVLGRR
jgi:hypothetical protein